MGSGMGGMGPGMGGMGYGMGSGMGSGMGYGGYGMGSGMGMGSGYGMGSGSGMGSGEGMGSTPGMGSGEGSGMGSGYGMGGGSGMGYGGMGSGMGMDMDMDNMQWPERCRRHCIYKKRNSYDDRMYCFARSEYSQSMCLAGDYDEKPEGGNGTTVEVRVRVSNEISGTPIGGATVSLKFGTAGEQIGNTDGTG